MTFVAAKPWGKPQPIGARSMTAAQLTDGIRAPHLEFVWHSSKLIGSASFLTSLPSHSATGALGL